VSAPTLSLAAILGLQNRFLVTVDGINLGGWGKCSGLKVDFNPFKFVEGGNYNNENILPGQVKYSDITLERAIEPQGSAVVQRWLASRVNSWVNAPGSAHGAVASALNAVGSLVGAGNIGGAAGGTGQITLCSAEGKPLISWSLRNVYPYSWKGPDLDAATMGIAKETLVLCHEGFL
jgi:phage tail-like protein